MASSSGTMVRALEAFSNITEEKNNNTEQQISKSLKQSHNQLHCSLGKWDVIQLKADHFFKDGISTEWSPKNVSSSTN